MNHNKFGNIWLQCLDNKFYDEANKQAEIL